MISKHAKILRLEFLWIFCLSLIIRVWFIDYASIDLDEGYSLYYSQGNWDYLSTILAKDLTPPIYYITLFA